MQDLAQGDSSERYSIRSSGTVPGFEVSIHAIINQMSNKLLAGRHLGHKSIGYSSSE